jgi:hypothetical protein
MIPTVMTSNSYFLIFTPEPKRTFWGYYSQGGLAGHHDKCPAVVSCLRDLKRTIHLVCHLRPVWTTKKLKYPNLAFIGVKQAELSCAMNLLNFPTAQQAMHSGTSSSQANIIILMENATRRYDMLRYATLRYATRCYATR